MGAFVSLRFMISIAFMALVVNVIGTFFGFSECPLVNSLCGAIIAA